MQIPVCETVNNWKNNIVIIMNKKVWSKGLTITAELQQGHEPNHAQNLQEAFHPDIQPSNHCYMGEIIGKVPLGEKTKNEK